MSSAVTSSCRSTKRFRAACAPATLHSGCGMSGRRSRSASAARHGDAAQPPPAAASAGRVPVGERGGEPEACRWRRRRQHRRMRRRRSGTKRRQRIVVAQLAARPARWRCTAGFQPPEIADEVAVDAVRRRAAASGATSTAQRVASRARPTIADAATIGRPESRGALRQCPRAAIVGPRVDDRARPRRRPRAEASAAAYALSLLVNTTARAAGPHARSVDVRRAPHRRASTRADRCREGDARSMRAGREHDRAAREPSTAAAAARAPAARRDDRRRARAAPTRLPS